MEIYDLAHALAKALRESNEYQQYQEVREKVLGDTSTKKMIQDYQNLYWVIQTGKLIGQDIKVEDQEKFDKLNDIIMLNDTAQKYLGTENRLGIILQDIQKIVTEAIEVGFTEEEKEA